jgi:hypothetical protein
MTQFYNVKTWLFIVYGQLLLALGHLQVDPFDQRASECVRADMKMGKTHPSGPM